MWNLTADLLGESIRLQSSTTAGSTFHRRRLREKPRGRAATYRARPAAGAAVSLTETAARLTSFPSRASRSIRTGGLLTSAPGAPSSTPSPPTPPS
ncbi:hypothetical protein VTG60DRAFT_5519 [Thermothelomyces hinnuleus]